MRTGPSCAGLPRSGSRNARTIASGTQRPATPHYDHPINWCRAEPDRTTWKSAFELFCQAFHRPRLEGASVKNLTDEEKRVAAILRRELPNEIEAALFDYDKGFLRGLGRMSLSGSFPSLPCLSM